MIKANKTQAILYPLFTKAHELFQSVKRGKSPKKGTPRRRGAGTKSSI